jgi:hypothetical protein
VTFLARKPQPINKFKRVNFSIKEVYVKTNTFLAKLEYFKPNIDPSIGFQATANFFPQKTKSPKLAFVTSNMNPCQFRFKKN